MEKKAIIKTGFSEFRSYLDNLEREIQERLQDLEVLCPHEVNLSIDIPYSEVTSIEADTKVYKFINKAVISFRENRY